MGKDSQINFDQLCREVVEAESALDDLGARYRRLWDRVSIKPQKWEQEQYPEFDSFWVVAVMGSRCLYFNYLEYGWGWGQFESWGQISEYHWE